MSRSRPFDFDGERHWFDVRSKATAAQLELLADVEGIELDDLLDEGLSQRQVLYRLHQFQNLIPEHVLERRRQREFWQSQVLACRVCSMNGEECEGRITRHHFVPRWMMLLLENYEAYAMRSLCTIPVCVGRHRDLHLRDESPKTIVPYLRLHERQFAQKMLDELKAQRPAIFELLLGGDENSYEYQLVRDHSLGEFVSTHAAYELPELAAVHA
jgi:hypothetical protein